MAASDASVIRLDGAGAASVDIIAAEAELAASDAPGDTWAAGRLRGARPRDGGSCRRPCDLKLALLGPSVMCYACMHG